jgi:hypothetical protein
VLWGPATVMRMVVTLFGSSEVGRASDGSMVAAGVVDAVVDASAGPAAVGPPSLGDSVSLVHAVVRTTATTRSAAVSRRPGRWGRRSWATSMVRLTLRIGHRGRNALLWDVPAVHVRGRAPNSRRGGTAADVLGRLARVYGSEGQFVRTFLYSFKPALRAGRRSACPRFAAGRFARA